MGVAVAIGMGVMSLASGVMGSLGSSSNAKSQAMAAEVQQRNQNFQNQWQKEAQDRNALRQYQATLQRNAAIERAANKERALTELATDKSFSNQSSMLSKQTAQVNAQFISAMNGNYINQNSGTARALLRQNMEALGNNMSALKQNYRTAYNDILNQQNARLSQRASSIAPDLGLFIPNTGGIADNSSSALATGLIQAGLQGASVGINASLQYSKPGAMGGGFADTGAESGGYGPPSSLSNSGGGNSGYSGFGSSNWTGQSYQLGGR
jgi:hypothetical protein